MIEISIDTKSKKVLIDIGKHGFKHRRGLRIALNEIGSHVANKMANYIFNPPKTGRWYLYKGQPYQASAPGESPANRSGKLAGSGGYRVTGYWDVTIYEKAYYAKWLEYGSQDGRIKPRPHLIRAVNATKRDAVKIIEDNVNKELKR